MLEVLHIRSSFNPGGTETVILNLFNFKQTKLRIHLALIRGGTYVDKLKNDDNIIYEYYRKWFIDLAVLIKLIRLIKKRKIKIIHVHQEIELLYAVFLKIFNPSINIFYSIHLTNSENNFDYYLDRFLINFVYKILPVSENLRDYLVEKGYPSKKLITLYNAVTISNNVVNKMIESFKRRINYSFDDFLILMTGNFRPEKDQLNLVKAFYLLNHKYPQIKLVFIGQESNESANSKNITNPDDLDKKIFYLGSQEDAWMYLSVCDLFVFSSLSETFGIAVIEALLMKTPVLASDIEVMKELSVNEKYFSLFKTGNANHLAEKIEWFIHNRQKDPIKDLIIAANNYAINKFSYENFINRLTDIYCE